MPDETDFADYLRKMGKKPHVVAGRTRASRRALAGETGVPEATILELVKLSDLARIPGVKGIRARLYYDAGVETPQALTSWEPEALRRMLITFVERSGFDGTAPLPEEARFTVEKARKLPQVVAYEPGDGGSEV